MIQIKDAASTSSKWVARTQTATEFYSDGVKAPKKDWATQTGAAEESYKAGVTDAANKGRFGIGVKKAGTKKWQDKVISVGIARWPQGVSMGQPAYQAGVAPYLDAISKITLPPRYAKGDPRNYERSAIIGKTLNTLRISQTV